MENMEKKDAGLPAGKKKRKIPWSMLYILATVVAVLLFGLFNQQFGNVFHTISNLTPGFLSLGVLISLVYFLFEGEIFRLLLRQPGLPHQRGGGAEKRPPRLILLLHHPQFHRGPAHAVRLSAAG